MTRNLVLVLWIAIVFALGWVFAYVGFLDLAFRAYGENTGGYVVGVLGGVGISF